MEQANCGARQSDRVDISIPIEIFASDVDGRAYSEDARTLEVNCNGALILSIRTLTPDEEVLIRVKQTGKESPVQVVGQVRSQADGFVYAVRLLDLKVNLWDITFAPLNEPNGTAVRVLLECTKCRSREVVHLEEFEAAVYYTQRYLHRSCARCRESTIWQETTYEIPERKGTVAAASVPTPIPPASETPPERRTQNQRRHSRVKCQLRACIRYKQNYGEEILEANDVSRGGIAFNTRKVLVKGARFDIAIPYSPGMANIFVPAEVVRVKAIPNSDLYVIGAAYLTAKTGPGADKVKQTT